MSASKRTLTGTLAVLVAATSLLTACDERAESRAAAIVDGTTIAESDVQQAVREFNTGSSQAQGQPVTPSAVTSILTLGHFTLPALARSGKGISDDEAKQYLDKIDDPSPATVDFVKSVMSRDLLDDTTRNAVIKEMQTKKITINPRYGHFDAKTLNFGPESRNWLVVDKDAPAVGGK